MPENSTSTGSSLLYAILWLKSKLPFWVWFRVSELLFVLVFWLFRYRRKVTRANLLLAFPEKPLAEIRRIERRYYLHLCDVLVETVKGVSMKPAEVLQRMKLINPELLREGDQTGKGTIVVASHYGNFEWANAVMSLIYEDLPAYTIYQKINNPAFEHIMRRIRGRFGAVLVNKQEAFRAALRYLKAPGLMAFVSDQSPSRRDKLYFTQFLGQPTAMHEGAAMLAVGRGFHAVFADIRKVKRGYYEATLIRIPVEDFAKNKDIHGFTDFHAKLLEKRIREEPAFWLWSHRRWKHQPGEGDEIAAS
ncbi:MAG: lysophospholipid acyltransferase family protein [Bacteroidia bacterium]